MIIFCDKITKSGASIGCAALSLSEYFDCSYCAKYIFTDAVPSVGIQKTFPEFVGFEIELQRPHPPEQINVLVSNTGGVQIDETAKFPVI